MSVAATLQVLVTANTAQAVAGLNRVDAATKRAAANAKRSGSAMEGAFGGRGAMAAQAGLAGVAYGLYKSVRVGMDFEKQMSSLQAVTKASGSQMDAFKRQALDMSSKTTFGAREVAQAQTELAKGGLKAKQILGGALPAALDLAAAGELDLAQAATTTVNAMKLFGLRGEESVQVADMLATAANTTTADVSDFAMALTQGGSAAKQVGYSLNDTVVVLEALAEAGIRNSDAGTSMKTALLQLAAPTDRQADLARKLGLEFTNQAGEMKNPIQLAGELRDSLGEMTKAQRAAALKVLAGTDGFRTLASLYDLGAKRARELKKANLEVGTASETAAKKTDNLAGDIEKLSGEAERGGIKLFDELGPSIRKGTQDLATGLEAINEASETSTGQAALDGLKRGAQQFINPAGAAGDAAKDFGSAVDSVFGGGGKVKQIEGIDFSGLKSMAAQLAGGGKGLKGAISHLDRLAGKKITTDISVQGGPQAVKQISQVASQVRQLGGSKKAILRILADTSSPAQKLRELKGLLDSLKDKRVKAEAKADKSQVVSLNAAINSLRDKTVTITTSYKTVGSPGPGGGSVNAITGGRAAGGRDIGPEVAMVGEEGRELMRTASGAWMMLGQRGPHLASIPGGSDIFTASETRDLLRLGIPGYAKGKRSKSERRALRSRRRERAEAKRQKRANRQQAEADSILLDLESALALAELTPDTADDLAAINALVGYWQNVEGANIGAAKLKNPLRRKAGLEKLLEARQALKSYADQIEDITGTSDAGISGDSEQVALLNQLLGEANQRFAVSQSQYRTLAGVPFGGVFHDGGTVPGPSGAERLILAQGGETISKGAPATYLLVEKGAGIDESRIRSISGEEYEQRSRRSARSGARLLPSGGG